MQPHLPLARPSPTARAACASDWATTTHGKSGVVYGHDAYASGFTQDDSHTYCARGKHSKKSVARSSSSSRSPPRLKDFSSCPRATGGKKDKFIGSDEDWAAATKGSGGRVCCDRPRPRSRSGRCHLLRPQVSDAGQGTPSVVLANNRRSSTTSTSLSASTWSTARADGARQRPVMIHSMTGFRRALHPACSPRHYAGTRSRRAHPSRSPHPRRGPSTTTSRTVP